MTDPIDAVRNLYEAITAGDVSARTSVMAPDIEWITVMDFHITGRGPEEVMQKVFLPLMQEWESFSPAPSELLVATVVSLGSLMVALHRSRNTAMCLQNLLNVSVQDNSEAN